MEDRVVKFRVIFWFFFIYIQILIIVFCRDFCKFEFRGFKGGEDSKEEVSLEKRCSCIY